jgi:hypothetical protein
LTFFPIEGGAPNNHLCLGAAIEDDAPIHPTESDAITKLRAKKKNEYFFRKLSDRKSNF